MVVEFSRAEGHTLLARRGCKDKDKIRCGQEYCLFSYLLETKKWATDLRSYGGLEF